MLQDQTLGEIACTVPGATRLFHDYGIDFCCGGKRSLREEADRKSLDIAPLLSSLSTLQQTAPDDTDDWCHATNQELIDHILERYHARHRQQLPELIRLAEKVERVHVNHPQCPTGLTVHLAGMQMELMNHMMKEEQVLFPMLCHSMGDRVRGPIAVMEEEHLQHGEALEDMRALAHQMILPADACNSWRALYLGLRELQEDLMEHIHLENNILFKRPKSTAQGCGGTCGCGD